MLCLSRIALLASMSFFNGFLLCCIQHFPDLSCPAFSRSTTPPSVPDSTIAETTMEPPEATTTRVHAGPPEQVYEDPDRHQRHPHRGAEPEDVPRFGLDPDPQDNQITDPYHLNKAHFETLPSVKTDDSNLGQIIGASFGVIMLLSFLIAICICSRRG